MFCCFKHLTGFSGKGAPMGWKAQVSSFGGTKFGMMNDGTRTDGGLSSTQWKSEFHYKIQTLNWNDWRPNERNEN